MNVVIGPADLNGNSAGATADSAQIFPQALADCRCNGWPPILGAEHEMVVQAGVGLRHEVLSHPSGALRMVVWFQVSSGYSFQGLHPWLPSVAAPRLQEV